MMSDVDAFSLLQVRKPVIPKGCVNIPRQVCQMMPQPECRTVTHRVPRPVQREVCGPVEKRRKKREAEEMDCHIVYSTEPRRKCVQVVLISLCPFVFQ